MKNIVCPFCNQNFETIPFNSDNECPNCGETYRWTGWESLIWDNEYYESNDIRNYSWL